MTAAAPNYMYFRKRSMVKLRNLGVPDAEIGRKFGVSRQRIGQILGPRRRKS